MRKIIKITLFAFVDLHPKVKWRNMKARNERCFFKTDKSHVFKKTNFRIILSL